MKHPTTDALAQADFHKLDYDSAPIGCYNRMTDHAREMESRLEALKDSIRSFATDFERIPWGFDGDCGAGRLVDWLFAQMEPRKK